MNLNGGSRLFYGLSIAELPSFLPEEPLLIEFDRKCQRMQLDIYKKAGKVRRLQKVPIGHVEAWRKK